MHPIKESLQATARSFLLLGVPPLQEHCTSGPYVRSHSTEAVLPGVPKEEYLNSEEERNQQSSEALLAAMKTITTAETGHLGYQNICNKQMLPASAPCSGNPTADSSTRH